MVDPKCTLAVNHQSLPSYEVFVHLNTLDSICRMALRPRDNLPFVSPRQGMTTYDSSFGRVGVGGGGGPRISSRAESTASRLEVLEDRLVAQEQNNNVSRHKQILSNVNRLV